MKEVDFLLDSRKNSVPDMEKKYIFNTYNRQEDVNPFFEKGSGVYVFDEKGKKYLDFLSGLGVNSLGHCHPRVVEAVEKQANMLMHTSNLYYTEPQARLAQLLVENGGGEKAFFCNSGAEANEAAIKLARKYAGIKGIKGNCNIITAHNSFHGRTMATVSATGQKKHRQNFAPLLPGFAYAPFNDLDAFAKAIDKETCAVMVEPVQGEGGVHPAGLAFLKGLRQLCDERGLLLIFDEIQCGLGRTGSLFAFQHYGVVPDVITLAKALGGGLPIGAMLARGEAAESFAPGDHASTFGGNPVACAAAVAVLDEILAKGFLHSVKESGDYLLQGLNLLQEKHPKLVKSVRGLGLMAALEVEKKAPDLQKSCQEKGLLLNNIGDSVLRMLPPLIVTGEEIDTALAVIDNALFGS